MKRLILIGVIFILTSSIIGCSKEKSPSAPAIVIELGSYELLDESLNKMPYQNDQYVIFEDSVDNEIKFEISRGDLKQNKITANKYNVFQEGDTVRYEYVGQYIATSIINVEHDIQFGCSLKADPYLFDPESGFVADLFTINLFSEIYNPYFPLVFWDFFDQRTFQTASNVILVGEIEIFGRTFKDVLMSDLYDPKSMVLFNYAIGIVSFTDVEGTQWRFDRFE